MEEFNFSQLGLSEKEEKILQSAIKVFSQKGYDGSTTNEIAKDAGVAEGTIFKYYKTKRGILTKILVQLINIMSEKIILGSIKKIIDNSSKKSLKEILKELFYDRNNLVESIFPMAKIILVEAILHEDVREAIYQNIIKNAFNLYSDLYKNMTERGLLRKDIEPFTIFRSILANIAVLILQRQLFNNKLPVNDLDTEVDLVIDIILNGIEKK